MHIKYYIIIFCTLCLIFVPIAVAQSVGDFPVIPPDSLTTALYHSFNIKLDSAQSLVQKEAYQQAAHLYAASFEDLKKYSEQRREHHDRYLTAYYKTEQKEQHIAFLNETLSLKQWQNLLLILLSIITIITLTLLFFFQKYRLYNMRQRTIRHENEAWLMELENEQSRLESRLHTLQAEKYQKELLAESLLVNHKNKLLDDLRLFFFRTPELNAYRAELEAILQIETSCNETQRFSTTVNEIHPVFYQKLQERAANRLSPLDLEYSRMIYMKMTSKEMAEILKVTPSTIRTVKHRLKLKLGLNKEDDLGRFIEQLGVM